MDHVECDRVADKCVKALLNGILTVDDAKALYLNEELANAATTEGALTRFIDRVIKPTIQKLTGVE